MKNLQYEKYDTFEYWFYPINPYQFNVYKDGKLIEKIQDSHVPNRYENDFMRYKGRPEYDVYSLFEVELNLIDKEEYYQRLIIGSELLIRFRKSQENPDNSINNAYKFLEWLDTTDFYYAPASTNFHDNIEGGLLNHSLKVSKNAVDLIKLRKFESVDMGEVVRCALLHDICKINLYESYMRNVKNEDNGLWEHVKSYRIKEEKMLQFGHGVSSMYLAMKFFKMTIEESYAIRWHMGRYRCSDSEVYELGYCNENYPLVYLIQFADQLSITNYA